MSKNTIILVTIVAVLIFVGLAVWFFNNKNGASIDTAIPPDTVTIKNLRFEPSTVTVAAGTTITWENRDGTGHDIVADDHSFSSPVLGNGEVFRHRYDIPGTYGYTCGIHPSMSGTIVVQ